MHEFSSKNINQKSDFHFCRNPLAMLDMSHIIIYTVYNIPLRMEILAYESPTVAVFIKVSSWILEFESPSMKFIKVSVSFNVTKPAGSRIFIITSIHRIWNLPAFSGMSWVFSTVAIILNKTYNINCIPSFHFRSKSLSICLCLIKNS